MICMYVCVCVCVCVGWMMSLVCGVFKFLNYVLVRGLKGTWPSSWPNFRHSHPNILPLKIHAIEQPFLFLFFFFFFGDPFFFLVFHMLMRRVVGTLCCYWSRHDLVSILTPAKSGCHQLDLRVWSRDVEECVGGDI